MKKIVSVILAIMMIASLATVAFAAETTEVQHGIKFHATVAATCTKDGKDITICDCGEKKIETIPATGHVADTATNTCKVCGADLSAGAEDQGSSNSSDIMGILQKVIKVITDLFNKLVSLISSSK